MIPIRDVNPTARFAWVTLGLTPERGQDRVGNVPRGPGDADAPAVPVTFIVKPSFPTKTKEQP